MGSIEQFGQIALGWVVIFGLISIFRGIKKYQPEKSVRPKIKLQRSIVITPPVEKSIGASQELINCLRDSTFGYTAAEAEEVASKVSPDLPIEEQIRLALKFRGKGT